MENGIPPALEAGTFVGSNPTARTICRNEVTGTPTLLKRACFWVRIPIPAPFHKKWGVSAPFLTKTSDFRSEFEHFGAKMLENSTLGLRDSLNSRSKAL